MDLAADGAAALDRLAAAPPDAVVLDVSMPRLDGLEVCRRMRPAGDRTPVLMLTARDAIDDRVEGLDAGADDYLVKPFALRELRARLRALLRRVDRDAACCATPTSRWTRTPMRSAAASAASSSRAPSSPCSSCSCAILVRCSPARRSSSRCGATTSARPPTPWACTWATCAARPSRRRAAPAAYGPRCRLRPARGLTVALRARLTLMSALIVGVTLVLASLVAYAAVRSQQRGQVDDALRGNAAFYQGLAARAARRPARAPWRARPAPQPRRPRRLRAARAPQRQRDPARPRGRPPLPVTQQALETAIGDVSRRASPIALSRACTCAC